MTRQEAINHLKTVAKSAIDSGYDGAVVDAVDMAREALEQEPCEDWYDVSSDEMTLGQARQAVKDLRKMWAEHLWQEPCEDAISRQAITEYLQRIVAATDANSQYNKGFVDGVEFCITNISTLPPVTPQPKTDWIPVSERLPEKYSYTLWCASSGCVRSDYFNGEFWEDAKKYCYEVIAWMPLPEPYRAESEDKE